MDKFVFITDMFCASFIAVFNGIIFGLVIFINDIKISRLI